MFALPCCYALTRIGEHRVFGVGMFVVAVANTDLGWLAAGFAPRLESLGLVFGAPMLVFVGFVTIPAAVRRFAIPVGACAGEGRRVARARRRTACGGNCLEVAARVADTGSLA
jgi:hypothetical protein